MGLSGWWVVITSITYTTIATAKTSSTTTTTTTTTLDINITSIITFNTTTTTSTNNTINSNKISTKIEQIQQTNICYFMFFSRPLPKAGRELQTELNTMMKNEDP